MRTSDNDQSLPMEDLLSKFTLYYFGAINNKNASTRRTPNRNCRDAKFVLGETRETLNYKGLQMRFFVQFPITRSS